MVPHIAIVCLPARQPANLQVAQMKVQQVFDRNPLRPDLSVVDLLQPIV